MTVGARLGLAETFAISRWCSDRSVSRGERGMGVFINFGADEGHNALSATGAVSRRCILFLLDPRGTEIGLKMCMPPGLCGAQLADGRGPVPVPMREPPTFDHEELVGP